MQNIKKKINEAKNDLNWVLLLLHLKKQKEKKKISFWQIQNWIIS